MTYDNTNKGVLFKNLRKQSDKSPDYQGTMNVGGTEYRLAAWIKTSSKGIKFMSLALSEPGEAKERSAEEPFNDDIPF